MFKIFNQLHEIKKNSDEKKLNNKKKLNDEKKIDCRWLKRMFNNLKHVFHNPHSSMDIAFDKMLEEEGFIELKVANYIPVFGFLVEIVLEIIGIFIVYYCIDFLAPFIAGKDFNNSLLYSMLLIPIIGSLKKLPDIFKSVFVRIAISDKFVVCKRGYFRKFIDKLSIDYIDNIELRITFWGELFNYGTIHLYSFGGTIHLPFLKNPCDVFEELRKRMDKAKNEKNSKRMIVSDETQNMS